MKKYTQAKTLTYLGALPFLLALLVGVYGYFNLYELFNYEIRFSRFKSYMIAHTYGAVIVAFLGGIQWGISLNQRSPTQSSTTQKNQTPNSGGQYFIISNVLALMAWVSLFAFASFIGITTLVVAFILALMVDHHAVKAGMLPQWFWQLRLRISVVVITVLSLLLMINQ